MFPYNGRRNEFNEKVSKCDIQKQFVKEFEVVFIFLFLLLFWRSIKIYFLQSLDDLQADSECRDLQIRFVHQCGQINYVEFKICDQVFKSIDLLEALSSVFHYTLAMNVEYPKVLTHIWQFIQLAIFQIEIQGYKEPYVESIINDLYLI